MRSGWMIVLPALVLSAGSLGAEAGSGANSKIVKDFKVRWSAIRYNKSVVVENPEAAKTREQKSETLILTCEAEIRDPNLVLGTSRQGFVTQVTGGNGQDIPLGATAAASQEMYQSLRYRPQFRPPDPLPKWRALIRTILQRPTQPQGPPQLVRELQPSQITMQLDMSLLDQAGGELRSVKGYFYVVAAGSIEHVDVPFEPNNTWVRLTPDTEIHVAEAVNAGTSFEYLIELRPQGPRSMRPLMVGEPLPTRMVVAQQFLGEDGKPVDRSGSMGGPLMPRVGGRGHHGGARGRVKTIRFVIAVDAKECRIPFEVKRIPLPKP